MNKQIDLSSIPMKGKLKDWKNSIGCKCDFVYGDISGEVEIIDYTYNNITIKYKDNINTILLGSFVIGKIGSVLNKRTKEFKIEIGTNFKDDKRDITILDMEYRTDNNGRKLKWYKYKCNVCGWDEGWNEESHILHNVGCSCCAGFTVVKGINDIATTHPELQKYFVNIEDSYETTYCTQNLYLMKCPNCGDEKMYTTEKLSSYGYACKQCGDGTSYGEKYIYSLLSQLNLDFISEYSKKHSEWCNGYRYDFYIPSTNMIIEVHGLQHYQTGRKKRGKFKGYEEEHENDINKKRLATANNIKHYIIIDARISNSKYIKNSILHSSLPDILNFNENDINWNKCIEYTATSKVVDICNYKNNHMELSTTQIGKIFKIHGGTVQTYLQRGAKLGICKYDLEEENKRRYSEYRNDEGRLKPIYCVDLDKYFRSAKECEEEILSTINVKMTQGNIRNAANSNKIYKGYTFKYITQLEFNKYKQNGCHCYGDFFNLPAITI